MAFVDGWGSVLCSSPKFTFCSIEKDSKMHKRKSLNKMFSRFWKHIIVYIVWSSPSEIPCIAAHLSLHLECPTFSTELQNVTSRVARVDSRHRHLEFPRSRDWTLGLLFRLGVFSGPSPASPASLRPPSARSHRPSGRPWSVSVRQQLALRVLRVSQRLPSTRQVSNQVSNVVEQCGTWLF